jgi:tetratricopeptide (TPR) repeat protein
MLKVQSTTQVGCRTCFNRPASANSESVHWGLGVGLQKSGGDLSFWHWGDNGPAKAFFIASATRKDGIAIFANGTNGLLIIDEIVSAVFGGKSEAIAWIDPGSHNDPGRMLLKAVLAQGAEKPLAEYRKQRAADAKLALTENRVNAIGYDLLRLKKVDEAIAVFRMNTDDFPKSGNVWDSLGEAYETKGDNASSVASYKRAVELDPSNKNAADKIAKLSDTQARSPSN